MQGSLEQGGAEAHGSQGYGEHLQGKCEGERVVNHFENRRLNHKHDNIFWRHAARRQSEGEKKGGDYRVNIDGQNFFDFGNEVDTALENRQLIQEKGLDYVGGILGVRVVCLYRHTWLSWLQ